MKYQTSPPPSRSSSRLTSASLPAPALYRQDCMSAAAKRYKYLRRLFKFQQMDFEFAFWQMWYLFVAPQKVYRNFYYRKETKSQFARDDPAFLVLFSFGLCASSVGFALVLNLSFLHFIKFLLYVVFLDCIGTGLVVATGMWYYSNKFLLREGCEDQDVEWGYAFDVHLNAYFPQLIILHVFQLFFYHVLISQDNFFSCLFGNSLWLIAFGYYVYINFLGYNCLPILRRTHVMLFPMTVVVLMFVVSLIFRYNICQHLVNYYISRL